MKVLVYIETQSGQITPASQDLVAGARELAGQHGTVDIALFGVDPAAGKSIGADRIFSAPALAGKPYTPTEHAGALAEAAAQSAPDLILVAYTSAGLDLGPVVAMQRNLPMFAYCLSARVDGSTVHVESQIYGGKLKSSSSAAMPAVLMMNAGAFRSAAPADARDATVTEVSANTASGFRFVSSTAPDPDAIDITKSSRLLCVGRGIGDQDVIEDARETASLMGAELVGSRPVIDSGWLPKERQVGKSGRKVKPQVYLALGVSGAPEHIEGMGESGLIIAVNTDANAPIFEHAHFGATVDLADFLPAFRDALGNGAN